MRPELSDDQAALFLATGIAIAAGVVGCLVGILIVWVLR